MAYNEVKCDAQLGLEVQDHLVKLGIHTPITDLLKEEDDEKIMKITHLMKDVLEIIGLDLTDDSLEETPKRIAKMYIQEKFWGLKPENFPKCTTIENKMQYDEMVIEKCSVNSMCEHHAVYFGSLHNKDLGCYIAYIPKNKVIGLSKLSRITEYFSARPQVQERLCEQISATLKYILETDDVAVVIKAQHFCVLTRGVSDPDSFTITSKLTGRFMDNSDTRREFMNIVNS